MPSFKAPKSSTKSSVKVRTTHPNELDIICGRGKSYSKHPGNLAFKQIIEASLDRYFEETSSKSDKTNFVSSMIKFLFHEGFKFLEPCNIKSKTKQEKHKGTSTSSKKKEGGGHIVTTRITRKTTIKFKELSMARIHAKVGHAIRDLVRSRMNTSTSSTGSNSTKKEKGSSSKKIPTTKKNGNENAPTANNNINENYKDATQEKLEEPAVTQSLFPQQKVVTSNSIKVAAVLDQGNRNNESGRFEKFTPPAAKLHGGVLEQEEKRDSTMKYGVPHLPTTGGGIMDSSWSNNEIFQLDPFPPTTNTYSYNTTPNFCCKDNMLIEDQPSFLRSFKGESCCEPTWKPIYAEGRENVGYPNMILIDMEERVQRMPPFITTKDQFYCHDSSEGDEEFDEATPLEINDEFSLVGFPISDLSCLFDSLED